MISIRQQFKQRVRDAWCLTPEEAKVITFEEYAEDMEQLEWELEQEVASARRMVDLDLVLRRRMR